MSLVFASIVPHSPFLIPTIGKENHNLLKTTIESFKKLEGYLYSSNAETLIIISPHGNILSNSFTMNLSPNFEINFENFGDLTTRYAIKGDVGLAHKIRESLEIKAPIHLANDTTLDYGSGIPLYLLTQNLPNISVIPIYYSGLNQEAHFNFGKLLNREIMVSEKKIAVIASGDLSHKLSKKQAVGFSSKAVKFDKKIINCILKRKTADLFELKQNLIEEVCECGLKSISLLMGILDSVKYEPEKLSYESPFGVGYLTMYFKL